MSGDRCRDLRPHFARYARGELDGVEALRVEQHLREGCPACAVELDQLVQAFASVGLAHGPAELPAGAAEALEAALGPQAGAADQIFFPPTNELKLLRVGVVLSWIAVAAVAWWGQGLQEQLDRFDRRASAAELRARQVVADYRAAVEQRDGLRRRLQAGENRGLVGHDLIAADGRHAGCVFLDDREFAVDLTSPLPPGRRAWVWAVDEQPHLLGELSGAGSNGLRSTLPSDLQLPARLVVTVGDEQAGVELAAGAPVAGAALAPGAACSAASAQDD